MNGIVKANKTYLNGIDKDGMGDACIESYGCDVYPDTKCDNGDDDENNDITSLNFPARYPLLIAFAPLLLVDVDAPAKSTRGRPEQIVYSGFSG